VVSLQDEAVNEAPIHRGQYEREHCEADAIFLGYVDCVVELKVLIRAK
jgi:hypothetical protein